MDTEALFRRQELVSRCSTTLHARHEGRMKRLEARRAEILAASQQEKGPHHSPPKHEDHGGHKTTIKTTSSVSSHRSTRGSSPTTSSLNSNITPATSLTSATSTSTLSIDGSLTGSFPGNLTGGFPGVGGYSTSYTATATAASGYATVFPSSASTAFPASATTQAYDSACALTPSQDEGPFYIPGEKLRSNLIDGMPGVPLYAEFTLIDVGTCAALVNAAVDIWSCNYNGDYGGFIAGDPATYDTSLYNGETAHLGDKNEAGSTITDTETFMRGQQLTDNNGVAQFTTLLPGWYLGRSAHIHLRVHVGGEVTANGTYIGGNVTHKGQTFFGEDVYSQMEGIYPYTQNSVIRTTNEQDYIWALQNGKYGAWSLYYVVPGDITQGLIGFVNVAVDSTAST